MIRRIPFQGALNFRDIGGYLAAGGFQTRWGLIYRSDSLHFLTAADLPEFDALGVRSIYDLRRSSDLRDHPGPREHIHVVDKTHGGVENYLLAAAGMTAQTLAALKDTLLCRSP